MPPRTTSRPAASDATRPGHHRVAGTSPGFMDETNQKPAFHRREIRVETFKASGPGGQHRNKKDTAVRVRHLLSGITAVATEHRSQVKNKELALQRLELRLRALQKKKKSRVPTSIPRAFREKALAAKHHRAQLKRLRKRVSPYEI